MRSPLKTADLLDRRLSLLHLTLMNRHVLPSMNEEQRDQFLDEIRYYQLDFAPRASLPKPLDQLFSKDHYPIEDDVADDVALGEVLAARGRLLDLLEFIESCWPAKEAWCARRRMRNSLAHFRSYAPYDSLSSPHFQHSLLIEDLSRLREGNGRTHEEDENWVPELEIIYAYHEAKVRLRALSEMDWPATLNQDGIIDQIAFSARQRYRILEEKKLEWLSREFIFNERLFLWNTWEASLSRATRYPFIYELANLKDIPLTDISHVAWDAIRITSLEEQDSEEVSQILNRIGSFIQYFGYKHFVEDVTQYGGQWGPSSGIGSREPINYVPSHKPAICRRIVLGIANGVNIRSRKSLQNILNRMIEHFQKCGSTAIAIVISDAWDNDIILRFVSDTFSLRREGKKFLFLLVSGRNLIPIELPFS
jgi:hypothetical protein